MNEFTNSQNKGGTATWMHLLVCMLRCVWLLMCHTFLLLIICVLIILFPCVSVLGYFLLNFFFTGIKCWKSSQCVSLRHFIDGYVYRHFISSQAIKCIYVLILIASSVYLIINEILPYFGCLNFTGKKKTSCEMLESYSSFFKYLYINCVYIFRTETIKNNSREYWIQSIIFKYRLSFFILHFPV